jgi:hypothetical protein
MTREQMEAQLARSKSKEEPRIKPEGTLHRTWLDRGNGVINPMVITEDGRWVPATDWWEY